MKNCRLTPKDWKERYKKYKDAPGYFVESFNLKDVDKILLIFCELEDNIEKKSLGGQNGKKFI